MSFIDQMVAMRDLAAGFAGSVGLSQVQDLVIRTRRGSDPALDLRIDPQPVIQTVTTKVMASAFSAGIQLEATDLQVTGVSGSYSRDQLVGPNLSYLIGDTECLFIWIQRNTLTWDLYLRPRSSERRLR